jgi:hypothetical protein
VDSPETPAFDGKTPLRTDFPCGYGRTANGASESVVGPGGVMRMVEGHERMLRLESPVTFTWRYGAHVQMQGRASRTPPVVPLKASTAG